MLLQSTWKNLKTYSGRREPKTRTFFKVAKRLREGGVGVVINTWGTESFDINNEGREGRMAFNTTRLRSTLTRKYTNDKNYSDREGSGSFQHWTAESILSFVNNKKLTNWGRSDVNGYSTNTEFWAFHWCWIRKRALWSLQTAERHIFCGRMESACYSVYWSVIP